MIKRRKPTVKQTELLFFKYLLLWVLFFLAGIVAVFLAEHAYLYIILFSILLSLITLLLYRKKRTKKLTTLFSIGLMSLAILLSII